MILFDLEAVLRGADSEGDDSEPFRPRLAVATVFDQVKPLQRRLARIARAAEPIEQVSELADVFGKLREFEAKIKDLARLLEPMRIFQDQVRHALQQFTPLETLDQELVQLSASFGTSLNQLAAALEPAVALHDRLTHLTAEFEPANTLRREFSALAQSFERRSPGNSEMALDVAAK
jgi:DNA repair exonuclease SbcCD ATPase subunit